LTKAEAKRRIVTLRTKLKLIGVAPHTLMGESPHTVMEFVNAGVSPRRNPPVDPAFATCTEERGGTYDTFSDTASAQTTVITREPVESRTVVTTEPVQLTPVQRQTIYRTIVRERVVPAPPTVEYRIGARVPESVQLHSVPQEVALEVPAIRAYKYMVVNNRVVLIDPATSEVVGELADSRTNLSDLARRPARRAIFYGLDAYLGSAGLICADPWVLDFRRRKGHIRR